MNHNQKGCFAEYHFAATAITHGYNVSIPLLGASYYDCILEKNGKLFKIQIKYLGKDIPVLGVCLGHQAIGEVFGGKIVQAKNIVHGKLSKVTHFKDDLFKNIENNFCATRYHSLIIDEITLPNELTKIAQLKDGTIMGVKHKTYPIVGIQFHPESYSTDCGSKIIENFFNYPW